MLKNSLYKIGSFDHQDGIIQASLEINEHHEILKGHFPGQPVLPGACMLQIVKEILENELNQNLRLKIATNLKFLQLIDPQKDNILQLTLNYKLTEDNEISITAGLSSAQTVCFKFQGVFAVVKV
ncbi:hotdog family protein [Mucilaginibacter paludis]|uniref:ApeI dehydratase-like domain-containing protein n=1 Tax=Mucilaginibacter paludis DSM 18603 TaxID=714943 RepID=H1Y1H4_9SPHI|nr:hypothetical protein [Mucilaginibacter paludis]EHQ30848.1 hypothetical protein Mucpa_6799 [Mucilaginibacter paludis DSM 18603]